MNVNLSPKMQAYVDQQVASGKYASADEVVEHALLESQDIDAKNLEAEDLNARWLKAKLEAGRFSLETDGGLTPEQVKERMIRLRERYLARAKP